VQARDERRMRWQKWNRQQQQSPGSCSAQSRCFDLWAAGADSEGRARSLPRALRSVPQATSLDISCRQSNCQTNRLFTTTTTSPLPPRNFLSLTGQLHPLTVNLTTRTPLQTPQWPTSSPLLRTSILVYHCILLTTHHTWTNPSIPRSDRGCHR
jgi:hypothetical protein